MRNSFEGIEERSDLQIHPLPIDKWQKIRFLTLRGGLMGAIILSTILNLTIISVPFDAGISNPLRYYITQFGLYGGFLGLILFTLIFYLGLTFTLFHKIWIKELDYIFLKHVITNKKLFVIISLIVTNFTLSFIPIIFLFPFHGQIHSYLGSSYVFSLNVGKELDQPILIEVVQGILEHQGIYVRLIKLIAIGILICTVFSLAWSLIKIFNDITQLRNQTTFKMIILELWFNVGTLILLIFNIIRPIWEFADLFTFEQLGWSSILIVIFFAIPLSNFFLLFLITGNFKKGYFVIEDDSKMSSRLFFAISLTLLLVGYSWIIIYLPY